MPHSGHSDGGTALARAARPVRKDPASLSKLLSTAADGPVQTGRMWTPPVGLKQNLSSAMSMWSGAGVSPAPGSGRSPTRGPDESGPLRLRARLKVRR
jgi:hypothetical protein